MKLLSITVPAVVLLSLYTGQPKKTTTIQAAALVSAESLSLKASADSSATIIDGSLRLYTQLQTQAKSLKKEAFMSAWRGYQSLLKMGKLHNKQVMTIIDFSLSSLSRRLFVVDVQKGKLLYNTYVAHGMKSGKEYAKNFSNKPESNESSLGFYVTQSEYEGKKGMALRLNGVEKGINDNALTRGIVLHGADYADGKACRHQGFLGRSEGCPAVPVEATASIIKAIHHGSAMFIYYPSQQYLAKSKLLINNNIRQTGLPVVQPQP